MPHLQRRSGSKQELLMDRVCWASSHGRFAACSGLCRSGGRGEEGPTYHFSKVGTPLLGCRGRGIEVIE